LIAIGAMTIFMNLGWESFGGWGIFFISLVYAAAGLKLASVFKNKGYAVPAGICATFVVALTPLAVYGLQQGLGVWPDPSAYRDYHRYVQWHWLYMELATLAVGAVVAWRYRYPFLLMPIAVTLWYLSMDIAEFIFPGRPDFEFRALCSIFFGLAMLVLAFWIDVRSRKSDDYAFWLYVFGVLTFWGGLTAQPSDNELSRFIYCCINILMIGAGALLVRRVFVVFGAVGVSLYLGHLASSVFKDSWLFPFALTGIGLFIVLFGIVWHKNERKIIQQVGRILPVRIRETLEAKRG